MPLVLWGVGAGRSSDFEVEWWEPQCWSVPCLGGMLAFSSKCVVLCFNSSGNLQQLPGQTLAFMIPGHEAALFFCVYALVIGNSRDLAVAQSSQDNTARTNSPQSQCFAQGGNNGIKSGKYEKKSGIKTRSIMWTSFRLLICLASLVSWRLLVVYGISKKRPLIFVF